MSAEMEFEVSEPKTSKKREGPYFSKEVRQAYQDHSKADKNWRKAGRPTDKDDPLVIMRKESRARLQKIRKDEANNKQIKANDDLMDTHSHNISYVSKKLSKIAGTSKKNSAIEYIETLVGKYSGANVLEGFVVLLV